MNQYLKENKFRLREEVGTTADFYKGTNQDYIVHCEVRENKTTLIRLDLSVPDREQAESMCNTWKTKARKSMPMSCGHFYPDLLCRYTCFHREAFSLKEICSNNSSKICRAFASGFFRIYHRWLLPA